MDLPGTVLLLVEFQNHSIEEGGRQHAAARHVVARTGMPACSQTVADAARQTG